MELADNKDLLQTVFDSAANGIAVMQPVYSEDGSVKDFSILLFNAYTFKWIGDVDYKGKLYSDVFPMAKETGILDKFKAVAETGTPANFESKYTGEGMNHWFRFTAVKNGDLLVVTTEDISERKQVELALAETSDIFQKQERLYDSITSNTPDLVYVFGLDYSFTYANKALLAMWGKTAEDAVGKGLRENGYEEWHAQMHEREIDEIVATKKIIRGTVSFPHAELGSRVYDYILTPVIDEQGEVEAIAGITRDITGFKLSEENLKQSETRLKSVIDQTPAPTLVLRGDDLVIEQINQRMLEMIGQGEEIIGKPLIEVLPELKGQYVWEQVQKVYTDGTDFNQSEVFVPHTRNGLMQDHFYNLAYRPLRENGQITGMIQVAIEVTEHVVARKKLEESESRYKTLSETLEQQVNDRTRELQRSNEDLQQFAHVASHDLKEPVRKIKTFTDRLERSLEGKIDEEGTKFLERIHTATNRMFTMIDGVLTYSTTNADMQQSERVDLNEVIKNIETDLEVALQAKEATIETGNLPTLQGAPVLLYQLFYNLINNSIKFAAPGTPPRISISSQLISQNDTTFASVVLKDNGIGFEEAYAEHIFETFTRLNSKDKYEGTGLGLALCKKIAERHGGSITAAGKPGEGAIFTITLPVEQTRASV
ncbi:MAG: PAS domain-containing sensor histidine kinase [Sphingobacteriales bacterium]|nr:MAG: PAS domain-containing sensor histidine kinase [Sphingobacteriales bacterium]